MDPRSQITHRLLCGIIVFLVALLGACRPTISEGRQELVVFAASSLTDAFGELAGVFEAQHPGARVVLNFASSSQLAAQLAEGAAADVFASANPAQMEAAVAAGRVAPEAPVPFATNSLALIVPADNPAAIAGLLDLARPGVQVVVAAPGVPVRTYTDALLARMEPAFREQFYANVVSEEANVRQVAAKVALGEADAGMVYTSDITPDLAARVQSISLPEGQEAPASYFLAPLRDAPHPALAEQFVSFVQGEAGQAVLARWGFGAVDD